MGSRASASRYARALLDVVVKESDVDRVAAELSNVIALVGEHADLRRALLSPGVPNQTRAAIVRPLAEKLALAPPLAKLLALLAERGRLELLPDIATVYRERLLAFRNIVPARVTSAVPLTADQTTALTTRLSEATGASVQLDADVDSALIGGLVARVGSTVYDGSIRMQLEKMKQQLVENA